MANKPGKGSLPTSITASLVRANIRQLKPEWHETISVKAIAAGVPFETYFVRLVKGDDSFAEMPSKRDSIQESIAILQNAGYRIVPPGD